MPNIQLNINYIANLHRTLGFPTSAAFLADWGRNKSILYRAINENNICMSHILDLCNRYNLHPSSFFLSLNSQSSPMGGYGGSLSSLNSQPSTINFSFSLSTYISTPKLGNIKWLQALSCLPYSYGKKARMLNPNPISNRMESKDLIAICEYTGLTPSSFFTLPPPQSAILEQIDQLQQQLQQLRSQIV